LESGAKVGEVTRDPNPAELQIHSATYRTETEPIFREGFEEIPSQLK
jgi:hypothetical protein